MTEEQDQTKEEETHETKAVEGKAKSSSKLNIDNSVPFVYFSGIWNCL
jgi:hypothetical protein